MALKSSLRDDCFIHLQYLDTVTMSLRMCTERKSIDNINHHVARKFREWTALQRHRFVTSTPQKFRCNLPQAHGQVLHGSLQRESADWLPSAVSPCYCGARAASPSKIWWQHLALSRRVSWFPSRRLVASRWLSLDSQAEHHLFRDCCDANKGGRWGSAVGITRGVEAEMLRRWYSLMRTSSTDSLLLFDVVMEHSAWCPTHQRFTRQCPFVPCLTLRKVFPNPSIFVHCLS